MSNLRATEKGLDVLRTGGCTLLYDHFVSSWQGLGLRLIEGRDGVSGGSAWSSARSLAAYYVRHQIACLRVNVRKRVVKICSSCSYLPS